jgi:hypothetical protein
MQIGSTLTLDDLAEIYEDESGDYLNLPWRTSVISFDGYAGRVHAMRYAAIVSTCLLAAVSLASFETPARASNDDFAYARGQTHAYQGGRQDEWRRQQSAEDGYRHHRAYNQNWRLGERYYEPDYGRNM